MGRGSSVGVARLGTGWWVRRRFGGEIFRARPDRHLKPLSFMYSGFRVIPNTVTPEIHVSSQGETLQLNSIRGLETTRPAKLQLRRKGTSNNRDSENRDRTVFFRLRCLYSLPHVVSLVNQINNHRICRNKYRRYQSLSQTI
jgi:hypothetical protein